MGSLLLVGIDGSIRPPSRPSTDSHPQLTAARRFDNPGNRLEDDIWVIHLDEVANVYYEAPDADAG